MIHTDINFQINFSDVTLEINTNYFFGNLVG